MKCQRDKFNLQRKVAYLNCAYMSPLLKKVEKAGIKGMKAKRKPFHIKPEHFFKDGDSARIHFSKIIDSDEPDRSVLIPSVSYGIANAVKNLPKKKGSIILVNGQFPSNVYPWLSEKNYKANIIEAPKAKNRGEAWNNKILDAIDQETAAVAIGNVHWADGTLFSLDEIRQKTRKHDAALVIDGTQSVGALPFSVRDTDPDALVCAGYKWLMGPYSIGMAYYGSMFDQGTPIEENWINRLGAEDFGGLVNYQSEYQRGSLRYEVGEHSNFILLPMFNAALKQILRWSPDEIQSYCTELISPVIPELMSLGYSIENEAYRVSHLFGIRIPKNVSNEDIQKQLKIHKVNVSMRGDAIRISPNVYNDQKDTGKLVRALKSAISK